MDTLSLSRMNNELIVAQHNIRSLYGNRDQLKQ